MEKNYIKNGENALKNKNVLIDKKNTFPSVFQYSDITTAANDLLNRQYREHTEIRPQGFHSNLIILKYIKILLLRFYCHKRIVWLFE